MGMGYGDETRIPQVISTCILNTGSKYEMVDKHDWHYVKPLKEPVYSIMVSGLPWDGIEASKNISAFFAPLASKTFAELI